MTFNNNDIENQEINFNLFTNNNIDYSNKNRYEYIYENYIIIINIINNKLGITIESKSGTKYEKYYTQEELIKINKIFSMYDKVDDSINILEMNNKNFLISIADNWCTFTIKLDIKELPKNKISDSIIFQIPKEECLENKINEELNLNNNNTQPLNFINELKNNNDNNLNLNKIGSIIQNLIAKIEYLTEENNEIKKRLSVLEKNNNELINIIKENRITILKEKNNSDSSSTKISNTNKILENENNQNISDNNNAFSLFISQDNLKLNELENENSPNFLTRIHTKYLKEKIKNKDDLNEQELKQNKMEISNKEVKNNKNYLFSEDIKDNNNKKKEYEEENYLYTNSENEIVDDMNLFNNKWNYKKNICKNNNYFAENYDNKKNIMCVDENEEEKKEKFNNYILKNDKYEEWTINNSNNIVGACFPNLKNSRHSLPSSHQNQKNTKNIENNYYSNQLKKSDSNRGNDNLF